MSTGCGCGASMPVSTGCGCGGTVISSGCSDCAGSAVPTTEGVISEGTPVPAEGGAVEEAAAEEKTDTPPSPEDA